MSTLESRRAANQGVMQWNLGTLGTLGVLGMLGTLWWSFCRSHFCDSLVQPELAASSVYQRTLISPQGCTDGAPRFPPSLFFCGLPWFLLGMFGVLQTCASHATAPVTFELGDN